MKTQRLFNVFTLLIGLTGGALAQTPSFLPPQPHKLLYADTVYREAIAKNDTMLLAEAYYLYGKTYESTGDLITSERWFLKSLHLLEPKGNSPELSRLYNRMGGNASARNKYEEAFGYIRRSIQIAEQTKSRINMDRSYGSMANLHKKDWSEGGRKPGLPKENPDSVLYYDRKVEFLAKQDGDAARIGYAYTELGNFFWNFHSDKAKLLHFYEKAMKIYRAKKMDQQSMGLQMGLAAFYLENHQHSDAWKMLENSRKIYLAKKYNVFSIKQRFEELYAWYYKDIGNWRLAFLHSEKLRNLQVSSYLADRDLAISRLEKEFEADKKDVLLKAKDQELLLRLKAFRAQQQFTFVTAFLLLATALLSFVFYRLSKKYKKVSEQNELLVREQNHRVKNNLQAISSLLSLQSDTLHDPGAIMAIEETRLRLESMAILHRKLYDNKELARVYLPDFLEELTEGVLISYGIGNVRLNMEIMPVYLSADTAIHLGLLVNELVTNACKYAFLKNDAPSLSIQCTDFQRENQRWVRLMVADNGKNIDHIPFLTKKTQSSNSTQNQLGFGLKLIEMESEQLYGVYKFTYENGMVFQLDFPQFKDETILAGDH